MDQTRSRAESVWDFVHIFETIILAQSTRLHAIDLYASASFRLLFPFALLLLGWS